ALHAARGVRGREGAGDTALRACRPHPPLAAEAGTGQDVAEAARPARGERHDAGRAGFAGGVPAGERDMNLIEKLEQEEMKRMKKTVPVFAPGDTVVVRVNVV